MKSYKAKNYTWLYFEKPAKEDLEIIQKIFQPHPIVLGEFNSPTYRPRATRYKEYLFMVLHFPAYDKKTRTPQVGEIDILIKEDYIITSTSHHLHALYYYFNQLNKNQNNPTLKAPSSSYFCLLHIIDIMINSNFPKLDRISQNLKEIEKQIFLGNEKEMVKEISIVKRDILNFRRNIKPQRSILESLSLDEAIKTNKEFKPRINDIIGSNIRIWNILETHKETIDSLEATNDSLFSHKINETMKIIAIFQIIFLPSTLAAGLFGSNVPMPINSYWEAFIIIIILMLITSLIVKKVNWFK
ncbi:MAG: hypothetical protein GF347_03190 [Candidatus Moranbacteria bacterium]|nr:hypothetical protein [Candidatus Moranbacteria bacterium]